MHLRLSVIFSLTTVFVKTIPYPSTGGFCGAGQELTQFRFSLRLCSELALSLSCARVRIVCCLYVFCFSRVFVCIIIINRKHKIVCNTRSQHSRSVCLQFIWRNFRVLYLSLYTIGRLGSSSLLIFIIIVICCA